MKNWDNVVLVPEFDEQGVACHASALPNGIETHPQKIVCEWVSFGVNTIWAASSAL